jgi:hypothetical protein
VVAPALALRKSAFVSIYTSDIDGTRPFGDGGTMELKWPSAAVAVAVIALLGGIAITAIGKYPVDQFLQVWASLGPLLGVVTGAIATFFFTREAVKEVARFAAESAREAAEARRMIDYVLETVDEPARSALLAKPGVAAWFRHTLAATPPRTPR